MAVRGVGAELLREFFDLSLELLCIAGTDGYFQVLNPQWERVLGYSQEELKARPFIDFVHPDDRERTLCESARLAEGGYETVAFVNRYRARDGDYKWLMWTARLSADGTTLLSAARDISELKRTEQDLRAATRAAEAANQTKSEFLATMSHELRTPLNSIIGFARLLAKNKDGNLQERQLTYLARIAENGIHLLSLINDILDLSRVEAGQLEVNIREVDLAALVSRVVDSVSSQARRKRLRLEVERVGVLEPVWADPKRLEQILINLVGNALKFCGEGGVLVRILSIDQRPVRVDVVDTGPGLGPDDLRVVFEPFRQIDGSTSRAYGGTGLGLSIARSLAERMEFRLEAASQVGVGSTFSLVLSPDAPALAHQAPRWPRKNDFAEAMQSVELDRKTVVLLGIADRRHPLERVMSAVGFRVIGTNSETHTREIARHLHPDAIVVTLDPERPELSHLVRGGAVAGVPVFAAEPGREDGNLALLKAIERLERAPG